MRHAVTLSVRASTLSLRAVLPAKTRPGRRAVTIAAGSPRTGSQQVCHNRLEGFRVLGRTATSSSSRPALTGVQSPRSRRGSHLKATPLEPGCSLHAGFGLSDETDSKAAVEQAISRAGVREPVMAFVSCTADRDPAVVLQHFKAALPGVYVHGSTSCGGVLSTQGVKVQGVGCLLVGGQPGSFAAAGAAISGPEGAKEAAASAARNIRASIEKPKAIIMATVPGMEEAVLYGIQQVFPSDVPIFGGTAADNDISGAWSVLSTEGAFASGVSLVAIGEGVGFGGGLVSPYSATDKFAIATKTSGRKVFELDGKPAADKVYEWLGDCVKEAYESGGMILPQTSTKPIFVTEPGAAEGLSAHLAAISRDEGSNGSIDFFMEVPEGSKITMMEAGDGPMSGYAAAICQAFNKAKKSGGIEKPSAALLFYCGGMGMAVGDNLTAGLTSEEVADEVDGVPLMGMTVFGEQGRKAAGNRHCNLSVGVIVLE